MASLKSQKYLGSGNEGVGKALVGREEAKVIGKIILIFGCMLIIILICLYVPSVNKAVSGGLNACDNCEGSVNNCVTSFEKI